MESQALFEFRSVLGGADLAKTATTHPHKDARLGLALFIDFTIL
jgi:hypothetical protein